MDDIYQILKMIESGQITATEGMESLKSLDLAEEMTTLKDNTSFSVSRKKNASPVFHISYQV